MPLELVVRYLDILSNPIEGDVPISGSVSIHAAVRPEKDLPAKYICVRGQELRDRIGEGRLATAGLADEANRLSRFHVEVDIVNCLNPTLSDPKVRPKVSHRQQRHVIAFEDVG